MKKLLVIAGLFTIILISMYSFNTCNEGGFAGFQCDCKGLKIPKMQQNYADGMDENACIGYIIK